MYGVVDYELGRLLACRGDKEAARRHLDLVMSGTRDPTSCQDALTAPEG